MCSITVKNRVSLYRCHQPYLSTLTLPCSALGGPPGSLASPLANTNPTGLHGFFSCSLLARSRVKSRVGEAGHTMIPLEMRVGEFVSTPLPHF